MTRQMILLAAVVVLTLCIAVPEALQIHKYGLADKTISHYLRGPLGYITDIGFLIFGLAMLYVGWSLGLTWGGWSAWVLGIAMLCVMATARFGDAWFGWNYDQANGWHVVATCIALAAAASLIVAESHGPAMWVLGALYPIVVVFGYVMDLKIAVIEKLAVLLIAAWLAAYALT